MRGSQGIVFAVAGAAWLAMLSPQAMSQSPAPANTSKGGPGACCGPAAKKPATPAPMARKGPPRGPIERYDCKIGTEDQHARIALLAQGGEVQSVAYYSKWKPRTCSVHLQRGDAYSKWKDTGDATTITTEFGDFLIQASRTEYQLFFREVDRMHYCGMLGKLNGSMTVTRGPKRQCSVEGIMERQDFSDDENAKPEAKSDAKSELRADARVDEKSTPAAAKPPAAKK